MTMSASDVFAAVESGEFDLAETTSMDSMQIRLVCLEDNGKKSR